MVEAAHTVMELVADRTRQDLDANLTLRLAIVRAIPWAAIVGMRNRLIHAYFDIDYDIVWHTASVEIPDVLAALRAALPADDVG